MNVYQILIMIMIPGYLFILYYLFKMLDQRKEMHQKNRLLKNDRDDLEQKYDETLNELNTLKKAYGDTKKLHDQMLTKIKNLEVERDRARGREWQVKFGTWEQFYEEFFSLWNGGGFTSDFQAKVIQQSFKTMEEWDGGYVAELAFYWPHVKEISTIKVFVDEIMDMVNLISVIEGSGRSKDIVFLGEV